MTENGKKSLLVSFFLLFLYGISFNRNEFSPLGVELIALNECFTTYRCKVYTSIPSQCTMVPDPADPLCCQVPSCIPVPGTNGIPTPGPTAQPVIYTNAPHAVVTGTGTPPTPTRAPTPAPQPGVPQGTTLAPLPRAGMYRISSVIRRGFFLPKQSKSSRSVL